MSHLLTIASFKGGAGKSTVSTVLAGTLAARGRAVLLVDADSGGTAMRSCAAAPAGKPFPAAAMSLADAKGKLHQLIRPHVDNYEFIIIDTPPSVDHEVTHSALLISDLCLMPFEPAPANVWACPGTVELVRRIRRLNPTLSFFAVANRVAPTRIARQSLEVMRDSEPPVLEAQLGDRVSYKEAMVRGSVPAAMGAAHKVAALETEKLVDEVLVRMGWQ